MASPDVSYTEARERLAELWDRAIQDREPIRLTRRGSEPVVLIAADEFEGLQTAAHLLRSPVNAARLLSAIKRARSNDGDPQPLPELRATFDRDDEP